MSKNFYYLLGIILFFSMMPIRGMSQTHDGDTTNAPAQHTHVVKKAWNGTKQAVSTGTHATAHATKKAWHGTKKAVSTGAHATAQATKKAWHSTKQAVSTGAHATANATKKAWRGTKKAVSTGALMQQPMRRRRQWHGTKNAVKKGYNNTVHPHAKASDKANVKQPDHVGTNDEPK